jgi:hypothetical protein
MRVANEVKIPEFRRIGAFTGRRERLSARAKFLFYVITDDLYKVGLNLVLFFP